MKTAVTGGKIEEETILHAVLKKMQDSGLDFRNRCFDSPSVLVRAGFQVRFSKTRFTNRLWVILRAMFGQSWKLIIQSSYLIVGK